MEHALRKPPAADSTEEQKNYRRWLSANPSSFMRHHHKLLGQVQVYDEPSTFYLELSRSMLAEVLEREDAELIQQDSAANAAWAVRSDAAVRGKFLQRELRAVLDRERSRHEVVERMRRSRTHQLFDEINQLWTDGDEPPDGVLALIDRLFSDECCVPEGTECFRQDERLASRRNPGQFVASLEKVLARAQARQAGPPVEAVKPAAADRSGQPAPTAETKNSSTPKPSGVAPPRYSVRLDRLVNPNKRVDLAYALTAVGLEWNEAMAAIERAPKIIARAISSEDAATIVRELKQAGAEVTMTAET
jgi:ribosomal protein L7/L12